MASTPTQRDQTLPRQLPAELWMQIANYLPPQDAVILATTNRQLYHCLIDQAYYRSVRYRSISMSVLMWAIEHGSLATAERALAQGQDPNQHVDERYFPIQGDVLPLIEAMSYPSLKEPNLDMIRLLLRYGADPYAMLAQDTPITISAMRDNRACLQVLMSAERDCDRYPRIVTFRDQFGDTVLHSAVDRDCPTILESLVEHGVKLNARDTRGLTALARAVYAGCYKNVAWLLAAGADPFIVGHDTWDLVEIAVKYMTAETVEGPRGDIFKLIAKAVYGSRAPQAWCYMTETQLHGVILRTSSAPAIEALHVLGANMDAKSEEGLTVLWQVCGYMYGSEEGAVDLAQALIDGEADVNFKSPKDGSTPLMQAIKAHSSEIVPLLLRRENDLDVAIVDNEGKTALDWAIELQRNTYAQEIRDLINSRMAAGGN